MFSRLVRISVPTFFEEFCSTFYLSLNESFWHGCPFWCLHIAPQAWGAKSCWRYGAEEKSWRDLDFFFCSWGRRTGVVGFATAFTPPKKKILLTHRMWLRPLMSYFCAVYEIFIATWKIRLLNKVVFDQEFQVMFIWSS